MEESTGQLKNKGGRPVKAVRKNNIITLKCSGLDKTTIRAKAKKASLSVSEYLRELGVNGNIVNRQKVLPKEVLLLTGTINHMAANLNQIARKRNSVTDELNAAERTDLEILSRRIKETAVLIKNYLL